ncbi:unnamed protein product [Rhizoctonia solani]|uniref:PNPLA domain-containing protein n=1 Tax=Rhizoctonia solani TaxID=456999 RepID=A0A8H3I1I0_9AGAM|nr:unnamed protein product [Rhizoctonia solani]
MPNRQNTSKGLRILCIDSGGVRGLSALIILQEIMRRLNNAEAINVNPHEYFDVIAGTGTGGISACMLGRLQMPIEKAIEEYVKLTEDVFRDRKWTGTSIWRGSTMYKSTKLQEALKAMVRASTGNEAAMMRNSSVTDGCKTVVFAMAKHNLNAGLPVLFRSYPVTTNPGPDCTICEALYATMAHPDLFKSIDIMHSGVPQSFVGGEIGCSNPLAHVLTEVQLLYPDRHIACIISVGAGHARTIQVPDPSPWSRTQDLFVTRDMAMDSERVAEEVAIRFKGRDGVYFRFNVDQGMQNMESGNWEKLKEVTQHTQAYLRKTEANQKLDGVIRVSNEGRDGVSTTQAAGQISATIKAMKQPTNFKRCPAPTIFYTGREQEKAQVIACITSGKHERRVCVVYGLGGAGKTQLVLKAIECTWDEWDHVIYIDASSNEAIETSLKGFAEAENIGGTYEDVVVWLEACNKRWLVVFDNADSHATSIRQYMPARGRGGSVLITTRLPDLATLAVGPGSVCHLSSMSPADGTALLMKIACSRNRCITDQDKKAAEELVKEFGYLALAIVHAGLRTKMTPTRYQITPLICFCLWKVGMRSMARQCRDHDEAAPFHFLA